MNTRLPAKHTIELSVRVIVEETGEIIDEAVLWIDKGTLTRPTLAEVSPAVQAGSYEVLKQVWPKEEH